MKKFGTWHYAINKTNGSTDLMIYSYETCEVFYWHDDKIGDLKLSGMDLYDFLDEKNHWIDDDFYYDDGSEIPYEKTENELAVEWLERVIARNELGTLDLFQRDNKDVYYENVNPDDFFFFFLGEITSKFEID